MEHGQTGTIVASVLEPSQSIEEDRRCGFLTYITDDPAHCLTITNRNSDAVRLKVSPVARTQPEGILLAPLDSRAAMLRLPKRLRLLLVFSVMKSAASGPCVRAISQQ